MGHSQRQALLEATILALVTILLLYLAGTLTAIIFQFHTHSSPEKALSEKQHARSATRIEQHKLAVIELFNFIYSAVIHTHTHCIYYLATLTGMHAVVEARRLVPADLTLHADPRPCGVFSAKTQLF